LTQNQIKLLNAIGMRWESVRDLSWERNFVAAKTFYEKHGHLMVNAAEKEEDGLTLGRWISQLRVYRKSGIQRAYLTPERIAALNGIGMVWDIPNYLWEENYIAAVRYHRSHGHLNVPTNYIDPDGVRLGVWLNSLRTSKKGKNRRAELTAEQTARLDALEMNWSGNYDVAWEAAYAEAFKYHQKHGNLKVPCSYMTENGIHLGRWIRTQRERYKTTLSETQKKKLDLLGMVWQPKDPWKAKFQLLQQYYQANGHTQIPWDYVVDGVWLNKWLSEQKVRLNERPTGKQKTIKKLTQDQKNMLASLGIIPESDCI
jgi:hypothetical protein